MSGDTRSDKVRATIAVTSIVGHTLSLQSLSGEYARLQRQLTDSSPAFRDILARAAVGGREIQTALPKGTVLIDMVDYIHLQATAGEEVPPFEARVVAFVVRPDRELAMVPLGPTQSLAELIDRWRSSYGAGKSPPAGGTDPGVELRKRLWEPLAKHLEGVQVVLVSPDGPLHGLPWAALPGSQSGTYLVHERAFAVVPVPQLLAELLRGKPRQANQQPTLLLAGGIDFGQDNARGQEAMADKLPPVPHYDPLPGTESEVNDLAERFRRRFRQAAPPLVLSEDQATKKAILDALPSHQFAHLATHGFFAAESGPSSIRLAEQLATLQRGDIRLFAGLASGPSSIRLAEQLAALQRGDIRLFAGLGGKNPGLLSGLVFAGVNRSDRQRQETILTALEVAELELGGVELVVLSACDTGRGRVAGGEGVLGLQRAFQLAGARTAVTSLWSVPDDATRELMAHFYENLWAKKMPKLEALRQAQLSLLNREVSSRAIGKGLMLRPASRVRSAPPWVWAAWTLSGDWR